MRLTKTAATRCANKLRPYLGRAAELLDGLLSVAKEDGSANLGEVLQALYPGVGAERAQARLRQLRLSANRAAEKAGLDFRVSGDTKTRSTPEDRMVWFEGEDPMANEIERFNEPNVAMDSPRLPQSAIKLGPKLVYVVYADADKGDALKLLKELRPHFTIAEWEMWHHGMVLPGENPEDEKARVRRQCFFTLQLRSPQFLASGLVEDRSGPVVPVLLHDLAEHTRRMDGFEEFSFKGKSFGKCKPQSDFALGLIEAIRDRLKKVAEGWDTGFEQLAKRHVSYIVSRASSLSLAQELEAAQSSANRCDVLEFLMDWVLDRKSPRYCALFGELGMGKTTNAMEFSKRLWERRHEGEATPKSVFLDLRNVGEYATERPNLDGIIERILRGSWKGGGDTPEPDVKAIRNLVKEGGLVIFDGLDEVLVHLTTQQGQQFTRQLLSLVPPGAAQGRLLLTCRTHYFRTFKEQATHFRLEGRDNVKGEDYRALLLLPFDAQQIREYLKHSFPHSDADTMWEFIQSVHNLPELAERPYTLSLITQQFARLEKWKADGNRVTGLTLYRFVVEEWLLRDQGKHQIIPEHKQMLMEHVAAELVRAGLRSWSALQLEDWLMEFLDGHRRVAAHYDGKARELLKEDLRTATFLVREEDGDQFRFAHSSLQEYFLAQHLRRSLEKGKVEAWALRGVSPETLDFFGQSLLESPSDAVLKGLRALRDKYHAGASEQALLYGLIAHYKEYPRIPMTGIQLAGADLFGYDIGDPRFARLDLSNANFRGARLGNGYWRNCRLAGADFSGADAERAEWHGCDLTGTKWGETELAGAIFRLCELREVDFSRAKTDRTRWLRCGGVAGNAGLSNVGERRLQSGHSDDVGECAWSPDGRRVLSASNDQTLKVWDAVSGDCLLTLRGHSGSVLGCGWSPDGRRVVSASDDQTLKIWEVESGACVGTLAGHTAGVNSCGWSPDGRRVVSASADQTLKIWEAESRECLRTLGGHTDGVNSCGWSPDGRQVVSASGDGTLKIWEAESGSAWGRWPATRLGLVAAGGRRMGGSVVSASGDGDAEDLGGGKRGVRGDAGRAYGWGLSSCGWSPDGRRVVSASEDSTLKIWEAESGECVGTLAGHTAGVSSCGWSPDGRRVVSASEDGTLKIWEAESGECVGTLAGHTRGVLSCGWSPDGRRVVSASYDGTLKIWEAESGASVRTLAGHTGVNSCGWSPDGRWVVSASEDGTLKIWEAESGECVGTLAGHRAGASSCGWSPDGRRVVSASEDSTLKIWEAESGECVGTLAGHTAGVSSCGWSPDGRRVVSASEDGTLKIWEAESGECVGTLAGHTRGVLSCGWSPDGRRVVSASYDGTLKIWEAESGASVRTLAGHTGVNSCGWSPDGRRAVSASVDGTLKIWEEESGECVATLAGHTARVNSCGWSPDGRRVVSASGDGTLKIWEAESGECVRTLAGHTAGVSSCGWSPDGQRVVSCSADGSVRVFDVEAGEEVGPRCWHLKTPRSEASWAVVDPKTNAVLKYGEEAWRSVGYVVPDEDGMPMWLPVEAVDYR